jgi:Cu/Ag efflux protein CusF
MRRFTHELIAAALLAACGTVLAQGTDKPAAPPKEQPAEKMTLEEMLALALKNNPDLRVAEAKLRGAEAELNRTRLAVVQQVIAFRAALESAQKTAADAEQRLKRLQDVRAKGVVPAEAVEEAALALAQAKAQVAKVEADAPFLLGKSQLLDGANWKYDLLPEAPRNPRANPKSDPTESGARPTALPAAAAARLRDALEATVRFEDNQVVFEDVLDYLEGQQPALNFRNTMRNRRIPGSPTFTLKSKERLPVRAVLQMLEDEYPKDGVRFVIREYGILVVDGPSAVPPGGLLLEDFLRGDAPAGAAARKNPPAEKLDGVVKQVDVAAGLVTISIGSDAGLQKGHTLEVFRIKPQPRYVGTLTVVEVQPTTAVGRVKGGKDAVQVGDLVASRPLGD